MRLFSWLCLVIVMVLGDGCVNTTRDVTGVATPQYTSIAAKTYITQADLLLVHVRKDRRTYLVQRDDQYFPYDPAKFDGKEIELSYGGGSSITDVVVKGTEVEVVRIEKVSGFDMVYDRIYGRILSGQHAGEVVQIEDLFKHSHRSEMPILPLEEYLKER